MEPGDDTVLAPRVVKLAHCDVLVVPRDLSLVSCQPYQYSGQKAHFLDGLQKELLRRLTRLGAVIPSPETGHQH